MLPKSKKALQIIAAVAAIILLVATVWPRPSSAGAEAFDSVYDHPSKCYSCESDVIARYGSEYGWAGMKAKSFDEEREAVRLSDDASGGFLAKTLKYY